MAVTENGIPIKKSNDLQGPISRDAGSNKRENSASNISDYLPTRRGMAPEPPLLARPEGLFLSQSAEGDICTADKKPKKRVDRSHISTEEEIRAAKTSDKSKKISLGDGLQAHFDENDQISFHYRLSENGHDTTRKLGVLPAMTVEQAREAAKIYRAQTLQERTYRSGVAFQEKLTTPRTQSIQIQPARNIRKKHRCFSSMKDAGKFLDYLFSENGVNHEIKLILYILLLIPVHPRELFRAKFEDCKPYSVLTKDPSAPIFEKSELPVTIRIPRERIKSDYQLLRAEALPDSEPAITVCLSKQAVIALCELRDYARINEYILPRLFCIADQYNEKAMNEFIQTNFVSYENIRPSEFMHFFRDMAVENSDFREEFIDDMIKFGNMPIAGRSNNSRNSSKHALLNWWGDALEASRYSAKFY